MAGKEGQIGEIVISQPKLKDKSLRGNTFAKKRKMKEDADASYAERPKEDWREEAKRFTPQHISRLLEEAEVSAWEVEGSKGPAAGPNSQHEFHAVLRDTIHFHLSQCSEACTVGDLAGMIRAILEISFDDRSCRPQSKTGKRNLFPLPVTRCPDFYPENPEVLQLIAQSLNSLCGVTADVTHTGNDVSEDALKRLAALAEGSPLLREKLPGISFESLFAHKKVDYHGEEIQLARPLIWKSLELALPMEVGQLCLRDHCSDGVLHFIDNFEHYLMNESDMLPPKTPRVICDPEEWEMVAPGLVQRGLCKVVRESELYHIHGKPLLNGMFAVSKQEWVDNVEVTRLIMNLVPLNSISRPLEADTCTLPSITALGGMFLEEDEVILTSCEDVKCFFYLFRTPEAWFRFMGFGMEAPKSITPLDFNGEKGFLCATVLPMGYLNSVGVAQHIHRNVVRRSMGSLRPPLGGELELRRDKPFSQASEVVRVYLDNFDHLRKVDRRTAELLEGTPSDLALQLRECYIEEGLPRHPKKAVESKSAAEVQGAWIDGHRGTASAKPSKVARYVALALEMLRKGDASQRELQVLGGGFVYISMFRRPTLSGLNQIWKAITLLDVFPKGHRAKLTKDVVHEISRFLGLLPLAEINFRLKIDEKVTASDASTTGGGACVSRGLSPYGEAASLSQVRGDIPEEHDFCQILSIGMFDGIAALRVALDCLKMPMAGHISIEKNPEAQRVVEAFFPDSIVVNDVQEINEDMVKGWALRFSSVSLIIVGAGPPCQGVSGLNSDRKGALRDKRSCLFQEVPRVVALVKQGFPWAQVHSISESVASMDKEDCEAMNLAFESQPWYADSEGVSLCHRPRLYWTSWEPMEGDGVDILWGTDGRLPIQGEVKLSAEIVQRDFLEPGWFTMEGRSLPTFTTSRPSSQPGRRPAYVKSGHDGKRTSTAFPLTNTRWRIPWPTKEGSTVLPMFGSAKPSLVFLWVTLFSAWKNLNMAKKLMKTVGRLCWEIPGRCLL